MARAPATFETARILEIGDHGTLTSAFPERSTLLWTGRHWRPSKEARQLFTLRAARQALREMREGRIDLVVVWVQPYAPWNWRQLRAVFDKPFRPFASLVRVFGTELARLVPKDIPVIAIDPEDSRPIAPHNYFLLDRARYFFKRELPVDRWQVFQNARHPGLPGARIRRMEKYKRRVERLRPYTIGCSSDLYDPAAPFPDKDTDVFAALTVEGGTTVRSEGIRQLRKLAEEGIRVDIPEGRIPKDEFMRRMAGAWLTWSPEGLGWDCLRHYEAPLAFSIPLINQPTITRYHPYVDGEHAFFYQPDEPGGLGRVIRNALSDHHRLRQITLAARSHVVAYHMRPHPVGDALLRMGLGLEEAPGGVILG